VEATFHFWVVAPGLQDSKVTLIVDSGLFDQSETRQFSLPL